ncbi:MAG: VTT domain-containing protein [Chloroflexi bacterium]|nr:VTT domain-containing protein [Chloroflexota bacterium]
MAGAVVSVAIVVAAGSYVWQMGVRTDQLVGLGYPGVFLVMLISGSGIFFPAAGQAAVLAAGALWNPVLVGLAAGLGNATGELTGYAVGRAGSVALKGRKVSRKWALLAAGIGRFGFFAILALALVPNPLFDIVGLLVGSLGYSPWRFWLACALGNSAKYIGMAYLGDFASRWIG